jgi:hypothetical protein
LKRESKKVVPSLLSDLTTQTRLNFFPQRQSVLELLLSGGGQTEPAFSPIFTAAFADPALPDHDGEGASEAGAVHREHFAELSLRHLAGRR